MATIAHRTRLRRPEGLGLTITALVLAFVIGSLCAIGLWSAGLALIVMIAGTLVAFAHPERSAIGLVLLLPFMLTPLRLGEFALFLGLPFAFLTGISLLLRCRGSSTYRPPYLLGFAIPIFLGFMIASTIASEDPLRGASRCVSVTVFAIFAAGVGTALASRRISHLTLVRAFAGGAALAAVALTGQSLAQFVVGEGRVMSWLRDIQPWFAGFNRPGRAWKAGGGIDVLRAIFPFMTPASAGQYMALGMVGGAWLAVVGGRSHNERRLWLLAFALMTVALLLTFSRQSWVGAALGIAVIMLYMRRGYVLAFAAPFVVAMTLVPIPGNSTSFADYILKSRDSKSADERLDVWGGSLNYIEAKPILGYGPGQYQDLSADPTHAFYAHNAFLDQLVEVGIPGGAVFIGLTIAFLTLAWRRRSPVALGMLTAWVGANMFDDTFYFPRNGFALALAIALAAYVERAPPATQSTAPREAERSQPVLTPA